MSDNEPVGFAFVDEHLELRTTVVTVEFFMVNCPTCDGMGTISAADEHPQVPCDTCDGTGKVRNPALEWQHQTLLLENDWYPDTWVISKGLDIGSTRWVAVGVKDPSE